MIDALLYSVRDGIRAAGLNYDQASCEIMDDGRPPPRCGKFFAAIHDGASRSVGDNQLDERYSFSVTLTMRVTVPLDRVGDQQIARNIERVPLGERQGFNAKAERLRRFLHMNWWITVQTGKTPNSANDNLIAWANSAVPSSTDTTTDTVTFANPHGWDTGTEVTVSATGGGLTAGTTYYINAPTTTTLTFHPELHDARDGGAKIDLTASITATVNPMVYGFCEPMRYSGVEFPKLVGGEWFGAEPEAEDVGIKATLTFDRCRRFQPVTAVSGPFV